RIYPSSVLFHGCGHHCDLHSFPTRRSSDLRSTPGYRRCRSPSSRSARRPISSTDSSSSSSWSTCGRCPSPRGGPCCAPPASQSRSEEHTSELQSREKLVCRLLLEKKKKNKN